MNTDNKTEETAVTAEDENKLIAQRREKLKSLREVANENNVPSLTRDVFLDAEDGEAFVEKQFDRLLKIARVHGSALAIAHPYPDTLRVLQKRLKELDKEDVDLVPVSTLLKRRKGSDAWQASLSR